MGCHPPSPLIGYVIQEVGLFPHFTVARNIGLVPKIENWPADRIPNAYANCCNSSDSIPTSPRVIPANFPEASAKA